MSKKRYEFTYSEGGQPADMMTALGQLGRTGWELVNVIYDTKETKYVAFLKKKVRLGKSHKDEEEEKS